jgi:hypothetical protein
MSSSNCLSGHVSMGSGGRDVEITWRGCVAVRIHWLWSLVLSFRTSLFVFMETVAVLFCPSVLSCWLNTFSVNLVLFFARNSRGVSACCASWLKITSIERRIAESMPLASCSLGVNFDCECCKASCVQSRNMSSLLSCRTWLVKVVKKIA